MKTTWLSFLALLLLAAPAAVQAQSSYTNADGSIYHIVDFNSSGQVVGYSGLAGGAGGGSSSIDSAHFISI